MAAIHWLKVHGQHFTDAEAREASDFDEVLSNFAIEPDRAVSMFKEEPLTVAKRLVLAAKASSDEIVAMLMKDEDGRIRGVIKTRLEKERIDASGGIIC